MLHNSPERTGAIITKYLDIPLDVLLNGMSFLFRSIHVIAVSNFPHNRRCQVGFFAFNSICAGCTTGWYFRWLAICVSKARTYKISQITNSISSCFYMEVEPAHRLSPTKMSWSVEEICVLLESVCPSDSTDSIRRHIFLKPLSCITWLLLANW